ncbi:EVE domain-containing protein [Membranicola marinus]|uniref:EVE domain-containing protein n=1 Tax=Membranihabitans marinus TaxID=1227546 RepID=A0A953HS73_9BACT|nr:EVE domain-containing protein [Membranihabitans marinus]MBY5959963.1 EVE domain-containing protein [Membranihabitans marinus]
MLTRIEINLNNYFMHSMIERYKKHISRTQLKDEIYKWELINKYRGRPNLEAKDFAQEISDIDFSNLLYHMGGAVIRQLGKEKPEEIRKIFSDLFNDSIDLTQRIKTFEKQTLKLYREIGEKKSHHQDERSIATYLTYHDPVNYTFYKYSFYKKFCNQLGIKLAIKGERYAHYLNLLEDFIEKHLVTDTELIEQVNTYLPDFSDGTNHKLLAQDILYQMLDKKVEPNYWIFQGSPDDYDFETALRDEVLTGWTVTAHKNKIKSGDKVILWITGQEAGCYALAEVTSEPYTRTASPDDHLWKNDTQSYMVADIKITHNLVDHPILKKAIEGIEELDNLKVGNRGTNFTSNQEEFEMIVNMIETETQFHTIRSRFEQDIFQSFINIIRRSNRELGLKKDDPRLVFSIRRNGLNFTIGQRYCFSIRISEKKRKFGVISKDRLLANSKPYGGEPPQPYYNYYDDKFEPSQEEWENVKAALQEELIRTTKSGYRKYNNEDFENYVFDTANDSTDQPMNYPLNTIFYGPPGTGKTYNTILRAAEIIENRTIQSYDEAREIFKTNLHNRIEFITFHQNYSYEDFIQGLRPDTENDSQLTFERKDGVFKIIADKALKNIRASKRPLLIKKSFEDAFNTFIKPLIEGEVEEIEIQMKRASYFITAITNISIEFRKAGGGTSHTLSISTLRKMYEAESVLDIQGLSSYYSPLLDELLEIGKDPAGRTEVVERKNYVIIIDEINRANISRVFGELITLIEPDKRSEGDLALEARLPSGDPFVVPSNLYIIGTMNTADKSIALLDIALRRRFEFEPMYPLYDIVGTEIHDVEILEKINIKIIDSKGHDFQIGHSYFMGENKDLVKRMNNKVIPLLLEYYMNDQKEVEDILRSAGLVIKENSWPLKITGRDD